MMVTPGCGLTRLLVSTFAPEPVWVVLAAR
jgi:hypothetical protein